jgi:hypothetical protein
VGGLADTPIMSPDRARGDVSRPAVGLPSAARRLHTRSKSVWGPGPGRARLRAPRVGISSTVFRVRASAGTASAQGFAADPDYWKGEVFAYVGLPQNLKTLEDLKDRGGEN